MILCSTTPLRRWDKSIHCNSVSFHAKSTSAAAKQKNATSTELGRGNLKVSLELNYRLRQASNACPCLPPHGYAEPELCRKVRDGPPLYSSTVANVLGHVRRPLNRRQEKKLQNRRSQRPARQNSRAPSPSGRIIGPIPMGKSDSILPRVHICRHGRPSPHLLIGRLQDGALAAASRFGADSCRGGAPDYPKPAVSTRRLLWQPAQTRAASGRTYGYFHVNRQGRIGYNVVA